MFKRFQEKPADIPTTEVKMSAKEVLMSENPWKMSLEERIDMTVSCKDTDYIPKCKGAGKTKEHEGKKIQLMHNGLKVVYGGYHKDWMGRIITELDGHHEPQEEKAFYEVMEVLKKTKQKSFSIVELGSFWCYYSLWFMQELENSMAYCAEPDPENMLVGKDNASINELEPVFIDAAAGSKSGSEVEFTLDSDPTKKRTVVVKSVDSIVDDNCIGSVDILHLDVQGVELDALHGAKKLMDEGKVRFVFVSTHHYIFSDDVNTHQKCVDFLKAKGASIITSHNVLESFSGDGLIVASFGKHDKEMHITTSVNASASSLFRPYERDLELLVNYIDEKL